jgi:hypothetical protein
MITIQHPEVTIGSSCDQKKVGDTKRRLISGRFFLTERQITVIPQLIPEFK